ncbi:MAG: diadenylate cyclase CdaA [Lentimicrobiaceae bacterium]|nr:diadenylate cyclase CdaA [Lentimicrobiaceae bacterium]
MTLLFVDFLKIGVSDVVDIVSVAVLFYILYRLIRGTAALNIFAGLLIFYVMWKLVVLFRMELLSELLGQFISVGIIALVIVFQPEIRQFLLFIGSKNPLKKSNISLWKERRQYANLPQINTIAKACARMSASLTGALIVITKKNNLDEYIQTGEVINARTSRELIETIFFKNTPLHDGALIISQKTMAAARCILPVSHRENIPSDMGLRHRSAIGITEQTDCIAIVVSEQTGQISYCEGGNVTRNVTQEELKAFLEKMYLTN